MAIGGQFRCEPSSVTNQCGPALLADGLQVSSDMWLTGNFANTGPLEVVSLPRSRIGGALLLQEPGQRISLPAGMPIHTRWLRITGLVCASLPRHTATNDEFTLDELVDLLAHQTMVYAGHTWQHLADVYRAAGHTDEAARLLVAQQDDRRRRVLHPTDEAGKPRCKVWREPAEWVRYWWAGVLKVTVGYGYQAWRAWWWLAGVALVSVLVAVFPPSILAASGGGACSVIGRVSIGLRWAVPLLTFATGQTCTLTGTGPWAVIITVVSWLLQLFGWGLVTLAVAGYTGIVHRFTD
jgi:hypothetical protein